MPRRLVGLRCSLKKSTHLVLEVYSFRTYVVSGLGCTCRVDPESKSPCTLQALFPKAPSCTFRPGVLLQVTCFPDKTWVFGPRELTTLHLLAFGYLKTYCRAQENRGKRDPHRAGDCSMASTFKVQVLAAILTHRLLSK